MKGLLPLPYDARDYDYLKSFGVATAPTFPEHYDTDAHFWTPDQNAGSDKFKPPVPPMPYGCTNYTQADLCADEDGVLFNPMLLENVTHANATQGIDLRVAVAAAVKVFNRQAYFKINAVSPLDYFDALRLAMYSTQSEKRAVSMGTPFFADWAYPLAHGFLPMPGSFSTKGVGWHDYKVSGWKTIDGVPYLICKMWCGPDFGDQGFVYMSRELCNAVLNIPGAAAFTLAKNMPGQVQTVDYNVVAVIVNFIRNLFSLNVPALPSTVPPAAPLPPNPTPMPIDPLDHLIAALIAVESQGNDNAIGDKNIPDHAYGCLQIRQPVCDDVNAIISTKYKAQDMLGNRLLSIYVCKHYLGRWATPAKLGRPVTDQDRARIWNGGPAGYKHASTLGYWQQVQKHL